MEFWWRQSSDLKVGGSNPNMGGPMVIRCDSGTVLYVNAYFICTIKVCQKDVTFQLFIYRKIYEVILSEEEALYCLDTLGFGRTDLSNPQTIHNILFDKIGTSF